MQYIRAYVRIEEEFERTISSFPAEWTSQNKVETQHFIVVGEYGLALETMIYIAIEDRKQVPNDLYESIMKL